MYLLTRKRKMLLIYILVLVPLGIFCKFYSGPGKIIVSDKLAGTLYVVFWVLSVTFLFPGSNEKKIIFWVTLVTCLLEFSQLLDFNFLQMIRSTFIGRSLIGSSFSVSDFLFYFIGSALSWLVLRSIP